LAKTLSEEDEENKKTGNHGSGWIKYIIASYSLVNATCPCSSHTQLHLPLEL
jgi:hypothetical protein